uniref:Uncharacterized protein n=1 Tax=Arundo donax TaxID=35708 RepID=A0A0A9A525_ARUDO
MADHWLQFYLDVLTPTPLIIVVCLIDCYYVHALAVCLRLSTM